MRSKRLQVALRRAAASARRACGSARGAPARRAPRAAPARSIAPARAGAGSGMSGSRCTPSITIGVRSETARSTSASMPGRDVVGLAQEARDRRRDRRRGSVRQRARDVEGRVVDGRHEVVREECPHDLAHLVGRDHARDAEPARELRRDRRLADAGDAAEQHHAAAGRGCAAATTGGSGSATCSPSSAREHLLGQRAQLLDARPRPRRARRGAPRSARASANERSGGSPVAMIDCAIRPFE